MPASCAIAGMCSAALVEPPVAATAAQAFSSALARDEVARQRPAVCETISHHAPAGAARQREPLGVDRGQHRRAGQREAERLGDHRHRVGGELAGARAERRRAGVPELVELASVIVPASTAPTAS